MSRSEKPKIPDMTGTIWTGNAMNLICIPTGWLGLVTFASFIYKYNNNTRQSKLRAAATITDTVKFRGGRETSV